MEAPIGGVNKWVLWIPLYLSTMETATSDSETQSIDYKCLRLFDFFPESVKRKMRITISESLLSFKERAKSLMLLGLGKLK